MCVSKNDVMSVLSRWEMQDGAELDTEEKAMVEELQNACFASGSAREVQEDPPEVNDTLKNEVQKETKPSDETADL